MTGARISEGKARRIQTDGADRVPKAVHITEISVAYTILLTSGGAFMTDKLREKAQGLPMLPGVYLMKDKQNGVIYVGKAARLKNRVSSYFHGTHDSKTETMVSKIADFDVIIVDSEFEALVLESSLIKHHMPKYNVRLRDDKGFPFIRIDMKSEYPSLTIVSKPGKDGELYLGPYGGRTDTREAIGAVNTALKLPTCGKNIKRIAGKERPCLNHHIGVCSAYCKSADMVQEYRETIGAAVDILQGRTGRLIERLTAEMNDAAESMLFEMAAEKRDRIRAVQLLEQKQLVIAGAMADTDVLGFFRGSAKSCFTVLHYINGSLISKDYELFDTPIEDDPVAVSGIARLYYEKRGFLPANIFFPVSSPDAELLERLFSEKAGYRVCITSPKRGDKAKLVETANINAREEAQRASSFEEKALKTHEWLFNALKLETVPERIEAFDVSNTGSSDIVAAMTVFVRGRPSKKDYIRFKIKTLSGQDDYHSMSEVVKRRLARYTAKDEKFMVLPDILLIDGGAVHASVARSVIEEAGLCLPVFGMVKDDRHKTRALVSPDGEEIGLAANPAVFSLIGKIQEEAHRFAVEYHRNLRSKSMLNEDSKNESDKRDNERTEA